MSVAVLIAEDNQILLDVLRFNLSRADFEVTTAADGREALEALHQRHFNLLITDCQMPRLSGLELIAEIRNRPEIADLPVVLCTAKGFELESALLNSLQVRDVICKPFSPRDLVVRVKSILDAATIGSAS